MTEALQGYRSSSTWFLRHRVGKLIAIPVLILLRITVNWLAFRVEASIWLGEEWISLDFLHFS